MDFKQLQSFVTVVRCESFTKAAERLGVSQPTVSTHVRMLEEELGVPLVLRSSKHAELTPQGRRVFDQAVGVLSLRDRMLDASRSRDHDTVYLGASSIPSAYILPEVLPEYGASHPEVRFAIEQSDSQDVVAGLVEGLYDIGLVGMQADDDALECVPFAQDRLVLVTPARERFRGLAPTTQTLRDILSHENVLLRREGSASRSVSDRILDGLGLAEEGLRVVARANDQETLKNLVESGYGVTIASYRAVADRVREGRLLQYEMPGDLGARSLYVAFRQGSLSQQERDFLTFLRFRYATGEVAD